MFFALSKILYTLALPLTWIVLLVIISILAKQPRWKRISIRTAIGLLLFFSNPLIANLVMQQWEMPAYTYKETNKNYDYIVVLSGVANPQQEPKDRIHFNKGADRIVHAIDLYKRGHAPKIIITGGSGTLTDTTLIESDKLRNFAIQSGVPAADVILEDKARNTAENALYTMQLVDHNSKLLVVTSAFHSRRAKMCFNELDIDVDMFPTDLYSNPISWTPDTWLIPSVKAFQFWNIVIKEVIGIVAYKWKGYI